MRTPASRAPARQVDLKKQGEAFQRELAASKQGSPTVRRTLTEPPLEYRQPAPTAATDELGEDEFKKQRRLKRQAQGGWLPGAIWFRGSDRRAQLNAARERKLSAVSDDLTSPMPE